MIVNKVITRIADKMLSTALALQGVNVVLSLECEVALVRSLVRPRKLPFVCFDVGANKGDYARMLLKLFPPNTQIHCFEPSKETFSSLKKVENIYANNCGLGDRCGSATLFYDTPGSGLASLTKRRLDHFGVKIDCSEEVHLQTLDNYCDSNSINYIDVLKVDVEGHELSVFKGAEAMLGKNSIGVIQFEFGGCNIDSKTSFQDLYYFLKNYNYSLYRMCKKNRLYPLPSYKEIYEIPVYQNIIALRGDIDCQ